MVRRKPPPRLRTFPYRGRYRYSLTICTPQRDPIFARTDLGLGVIAQLRRCAEHFGFAVILYCLMPDHAHLLIEGTRPDSNLLECVRIWKQKTAFDAKQKTGTTLWQRSYFDKVLRDDEATNAVARYILWNSVREGLADSPAEYQLLGSFVTTVADLLARASEDGSMVRESSARSSTR